MEEYLTIKDQFKIDDSHSKIRGFVVCKTKDGKVIFTKENMIVKEGRALILAGFLDGNHGAPKFHGVSGSEYKMSTPEDSISTGAALYKSFGTGDYDMAVNSTQFERADSEENLVEGKYFVNTNELYIHFKLKKVPTRPGSVTSSFGLAVEDSDYDATDDDKKSHLKLFSRVTFPSYPDSINLVFDYYIYF